MKNIKLSKRLETVANFVGDNQSIADIGTDHAYLLIYLACQNKITKAIASEIATGPLNNAKENIQKYNINVPIDLRLGDGATTLVDNTEVDILSVNGMGGKTIVHILEDGYEQNKLPNQLILQPNTDEWLVRFWLNQHNYSIENEVILEENNEVYEVINAMKKNNQEELTDLEIKFGPILSKEKNDLFINKYQKELDKYQRIIKNIPYKNEKYHYINLKIKELEDILL